MDVAETPPGVEFDLRTSAVTEGDACLQWLRQSYIRSTITLDTTDKGFVRLMNDLSACATHRWSRFSHPSPVYTAAPSFDERSPTAQFTKGKNGLRVTLCDAVGCDDTQRSPSRHILTALVRRRESCGTAQRPQLGGCVTPLSPLSGSVRFLLFPQRKHAIGLETDPNRLSSMTVPQEFTSFLRGTLSLEPFAFAMAFSHKFLALSHRVDSFDAFCLQCYANTLQRVRSLCASSAALSEVVMRQSGASMTLFHSNPRRSVGLESGYTLARPKGEGEEVSIASLAVMDRYDSAVQCMVPFFPRGVYRLRWSAGPGVESSSSADAFTIFGKLSTDGWLEWPLCRRLWLRLRYRAALARPLAFGAKDTPATHRLFWATQGPQWNAQQLRGFGGNESPLQSAQRWYTLLSAEVMMRRPNAPSSGEALGGEMGGMHKPWGLLYANCGFVDSLTQPPRASVGFSVSAAPRRVVDVFNGVVPSAFECSFSWRLKFDKHGVSLDSGLDVSQPPEKSVVQLSPLETFRHFRCGLTWNL